MADRIPPGAVFLFYEMKIQVNGEMLDTGASTLEGLLEELRINPGRVAIEVNLAIIKKKDFPQFRIKENDSIEIVNFVGGGQ